MLYRVLSNYGRQCPKVTIISGVVKIDPNPAQLSIHLSRLFPDDARVAELRGPGNPALLLPAEAAFLGLSVPMRAQEFAAGRVCARRALAEFGIEDFPIERAADRQPIWPQAMVGSITHTVGFCAAVVAARTTAAAIGLDSEGLGGTPLGGTPLGGTLLGGTPVGGAPPAGASSPGAPGPASARPRGVKPRLWPSICVAEEIEWLGTLPESQRILAATLIFSAKEAFYKCQYPLTQQRLGFHDARIELLEWNGQRGSLAVAATRAIAFAAHAPLPLTGQYLFHEEFVTTGVFVPA